MNPMPTWTTWVSGLNAGVMLMKQQGKTIFLISHRPQVMAVADRLLILADGQVQASGPKDGVLAALTKAQQQANAEVQTTRRRLRPRRHGVKSLAEPRLTPSSFLYLLYDPIFSRRAASS